MGLLQFLFFFVVFAKIAKIAPSRRARRDLLCVKFSCRTELGTPRFDPSKVPTFHQFLKNFHGKTRKNCELLPPIRYQTTLQHLRFIVSEPRPERSTATPISAESTLGSSLGPTERGSSLGPTERGLILLLILSTSLFFAPPGSISTSMCHLRGRSGVLKFKYK